MVISERGPALDTFMDLPLSAVRAYGAASLHIRNHLADSQGALIIPLRGAAPLEWVAEGLPDIEDSPTEHLQRIVLPAGLGYHVRTDNGNVRFGRMYRGTRNAIVRAGLTEILDESEGITVLDEVQLGARITRMANMCAGYARNHDIALPVRAIAIEDLVRKTKRMDRYTNLVSGMNPDIVVRQITAPLIGTDTKELLPEVTYTYDRRELLDITVVENPEAELLFRCVGTMSRYPEFARDISYVFDMVKELPTRRSQNDVGAWAVAFCHTMSNR